MITFSSHVDGYYDVADQMVHYLRVQAERAFTLQLEEKERISSVEEFERRRERVRRNFLEAIGGLPEEKTPLNPICTGTIDRGDFVIEKIIYESFPNFHVTSALYIPKGLKSPAPAVVFVHGHSDLGKGYPVYQAVCVDLVKNGFVVFAIDPPGQGEMKQYYDPQTGEVRIKHCTDEHTYAGLQYVVSGANLARVFIWDVIRGVDYLETREEVDPNRIGLTGNSGGGTQSSYLMLVEPRFKAAVPCTFIMTLESYMKTGQSQDSEQIIRGCFVDGPDHDDYVTGMAPKPVLIGAAAYDYFPIEGTLETLRRAKRIYALYGAEDKVNIAIAPTRHAYSPYLRQAAVNWFKKHLKGEEPDFKTGEPETLPPEELWCTPKGFVLEMFPNARTVFDLNRKWVERNCPPQPIHDVDELRDAVVEVLGIDLSLRNEPIHPRIIWDGETEGFKAEKIFFFSEPDIVVTGVMIHPNIHPVRTDIVVFENGTSEIPHRKKMLEDMLQEGRRLFVFDVRGVGAVQVRPVNRGGKPHDTEYKLGCDAMMLKRSTLGMRVFDVLRAYDYLAGRDDVEEIGIVGVDAGAVWAYYAAALEDGICRAELHNMLRSYRDLVNTKDYNRDLYNLKVMAWGILRRFDLPDLKICFKGRKCISIDPRDARGEVITESQP